MRVKAMYAEKTLADALGVSQATLRAAAAASGMGENERRLVRFGGRELAAFSVAGVRALVRWLSDEKNAPRNSGKIRERRLAAILLGSELTSEQKNAPERLELAAPGGFSLPENLELIVTRWSMNPRILLCGVRESEKNALRPSFEQRGISIQSLILRVEVHKKDNFILGMSVPCEWVESDLFRCTAKRMPRFRGRW